MGKKEKTTADLASGTPQRNYKDTVFRMLYRDKSELLELYNAVNSTQYTDPEKLEAAGLENAIYMAMKNDVACIVDLRLDLYEHQSTVNPNMPLRDLFYIAKLYPEREKEPVFREQNHDSDAPLRRLLQRDGGTAGAQNPAPVGIFLPAGGRTVSGTGRTPVKHQSGEQ